MNDLRVTVVDRRCEESIGDRRCTLPGTIEERDRWLCVLHGEEQ